VSEAEQSPISNVRWAALGGGYGELHPSKPALPLFLQLFILSLFLMAGPTDTVPPPSYQMSLQEYDQKTSSAVQLSSSTTVLVDEDGWPIYDAAAFEAVAGSSDRPPPASTSAGIIGTDTHRNERRGRQSFEKVPTSPRSMKKVRSCLLVLLRFYSSNSSNSPYLQTRSSERRGRNPRPDDEYSSEHRAMTPPPPFTPTGPSLDGPPFDHVVRMSYDESDSQAASPLEPAYSPRARSSPPPPPQVLRPVEPLRLQTNRNRHSDSHIQTPHNPFPYHRTSPILPDVQPRPIPTSTITRVEFDPRMAYSSSGGVGDHAAIQAGAAAFYKQVDSIHHYDVFSNFICSHAVASQLTTSPTASAPIQPGYVER
jgi:hypothetical protein